MAKVRLNEREVADLVTGGKAARAPYCGVKPKKQKLCIEISQSDEEGFCYMTISEQSQRGENFGVSGCFYSPVSKVLFRSCKAPAYQNRGKYLEVYVLGSEKYGDATKIRIRSNRADRIKKASEHFNAVFS